MQIYLYIIINYFFSRNCCIGQKYDKKLRSYFTAKSFKKNHILCKGKFVTIKNYDYLIN